MALPLAAVPTQTHRAIAMILRLLLISFLLSLAFDAHAAIDTIRSANGESGGPCPSATASGLATVPDAQPGTAVPAAGLPPEAAPAPRASGAGTSQPRPGLRWHSFLPGMMK